MDNGYNRPTPRTRLVHRHILVYDTINQDETFLMIVWVLTCNVFIVVIFSFLLSGMPRLKFFNLIPGRQDRRNHNVRGGERMV